jgi:hypothetical protein
MSPLSASQHRPGSTVGVRVGVLDGVLVGVIVPVGVAVGGVPVTVGVGVEAVKL